MSAACMAICFSLFFSWNSTLIAYSSSASRSGASRTLMVVWKYGMVDGNFSVFGVEGEKKTVWMYYSPDDTDLAPEMPEEVPDTSFHILFVVFVIAAFGYALFTIEEQKRVWMDLNREDWEPIEDSPVDPDVNPSNGTPFFLDPEASRERVFGLLFRDGGRGQEIPEPCRDLSDAQIRDVFCSAFVMSTGDVEELSTESGECKGFADSDCPQLRRCVRNILLARNEEFFTEGSLPFLGSKSLSAEAVRKYSCHSFFAG